MDELKPTPRNKLLGLIADNLREGLDFATYNGQNKPMNMLAELLALPAIQKTADRLSYGEPLTTGKGFTTRLQPETFDAAMGVLPFTGSMGRGANYAAEGLNKGAAMIGKAAAPSTERLVNAVMAKGGLPAQLMQDMAHGTKSPAIVFPGNERLLKILERNGESIAPKFPQSEALDLAQKRAALPISENGLGLPANNTAMDRANAMFPTDVYHGTNVPIEKIDPSMFGSSTGANSAKQGFWSVDNPTVSGGYAEYAANEAPIKKILQEADFQEKLAQRTGNWDKYDSLVAKAEELESANYANPLKGQNIMPLRLNTQNSSVMDAGGNSFVGAENDINRFLKQSKFNGKDVAEIKNLDDAVGRVDLPANHYAIFNPDNIRSRFAAFDPWRRNAAIAAAMGVAAPDLLAKDNNDLASILKSRK